MSLDSFFCYGQAEIDTLFQVCAQDFFIVAMRENSQSVNYTHSSCTEIASSFDRPSTPAESTGDDDDLKNCKDTPEETSKGRESRL